MTLTGLCKCVLACRVSPEQKRLMVRLVKRGSTSKTTAAAAAAASSVAALTQWTHSFFDGAAAGQCQPHFSCRPDLT